MGCGKALGHEPQWPGDGVITGHGTIDGRGVFLFAPKGILCLRAVRRLIDDLPSNGRQTAPFLDPRDPTDLVEARPGQAVETGDVLLTFEE